MRQRLLAHRAAFLFCAAFLLVAAAATAKGRGEQSLQVLRVGALKGPTGVGIVKLLEDTSRLRGVEIRYDISSSPDLIISKLLAGEVDFANLPTNAAAKLYNGGVPIRLAGMNTWGVLYLLTRNGAVTGWRNLRGKTVALFGRGATPDIVMRYLLEEHGLTPDEDVRLDFTAGQVELAQLMLAGKIETALMPEPFVTKVLEAAPDVRIALDLQEEWRSVLGEETPMAMGCLVVRSPVVEAAPGLVDAYLKAYQRSIQWVNAHPAEAALLIEKHGLGLDAATAEKAVPRSNNRFVSAREARPAVEGYLSVLLSYAPASVGGKLPDEEFYLR